jgi:hypothetical protein
MYVTSYTPEVHLEDLDPSVLEMAKYNLGQLQGDDFSRTFSSESIGGHPGGAEVVGGREYTCAGINGLVNMSSGRIVTFGNEQTVEAELSGDPSLGYFGIRLGVNFSEDRLSFRVLSVETRLGQTMPSHVLLAVLGGAVLLNEALASGQSSLYGASNLLE